MTQIEQTLTEVARRWRDQGISLLPPATASAVSEFESRFDVMCPSDFSTYLMRLGGMRLGEGDQNLIRFWPIHEIEPGSQTSEAGYFAFADHSLWAHEYGICLSSQNYGAVAFLGFAEPKRIASSFTVFLNAYLYDIDSIF